MVSLRFVIQLTAVSTFIVFLVLVYFPRVRGKGFKRFFFRSTRASRSTLLFVFFYAVLFGTLFFYAPRPSPRPVYELAALVAIIGLLLALTARLQFRSHWSPITNPVRSEEVMQSGVFSQMRHPIYVGRLLFFAGTVVMLNWYLSPLIILYWWVLKTRLLLEEEGLLQKNKQYRSYVQKVKRFFFWR